LLGTRNLKRCSPGGRSGREYGGKGVPSSWNATYFLFLHQALTTGSVAFVKKFPPIPRNCPCGEEETLRHLLFDCPLAQSVWKEARKYAPSLLTLKDVVAPPIPRRNHMKTLQAHRAAIQTLWLSRCEEIYGGTARTTPGTLARFIALKDRLTLATQHGFA